MVKTIFSLLLLAVFSPALSQQFDTTYQKQWMEIDTLVSKKDLTKTALEKIKQLYNRAGKERKPVQAARCLLYQYTLEERVSAADINPVFKEIRKEITESKDAVQQAVLHTLLAKLYRNYFLQHRYRLYQKKNNTGYSNADISTWGMDDFNTAILKEYKAALSDKERLQKESVEKYAALLLPGNLQELRPTLYDLLAQDALSYFTAEEIVVTRPVYSFQLSDTRSLGDINTFLSTPFPTSDSSSSKWISLKIYQDLIGFHQRAKQTDALLAVNIERLEWAYRVCISTNKDLLYRQALEEITRNYPGNRITTKAWQLLMLIEFNQASAYQPGGDSIQRMGYVRAKAIAEKAIGQFTSTTTAATVTLKNLLSQINRKELSCETELANIPDKPFRALVSYRNIDTLYTRIIAVDYNKLSDKSQWNKDSWKEALAVKPVQTNRQLLPAADDHQKHSTEIKIDALPVGDYAIILSGDASFSEEKSRMSIQHFAVTNISFIKNKGDYFVLNRETGRPMADVKVRIIRQVMISRTQKMIGDTIATRMTDKNGYFRFITNNPGSFHYQFTTNNDHFNSKSYDYNSPSYDPSTAAETLERFPGLYEQQSRRVYFFTDRSIYRPGQFIYFKGIAVTRDAKTQISRIITSDTGMVYLRDVNRRIIDSLKVSLNEFGSFTGRFSLPQNLLTGRFTLEYPRYNNNSFSFSVEEYKRPKFGVQFEPIKNAYRLNDSVAVTGTAMALAGNAVDGAKVSYRITRNTNVIGFRDFRRPYPYFPQKEIGAGETITDTKGKFVLHFKADADDLKNNNDALMQNFTVSVNITDNNGETHGATTNIRVGSQSIMLQLWVPNVMDADSLKKIMVRTTNLSYEPETTRVQINIYTLQAPNRMIRKRYWQKPDQFIYNKKQFLGWFPNDEYNEESNYMEWAIDKKIAQGEVNSNEKNGFDLTGFSLPAGYYKVEASTKDKYGSEIIEKTYFQLFSSRQLTLPYPSYDFFYQKEFSAEPGTKATILGGSNADNLFVISTTNKPGKYSQAFTFSNRKTGIHDLSYRPAETERGIINTTDVYVINNRVYQKQYYLQVPWSNKVLRVKYASFRDKTEPGSEEKWTVTVSGNNGEKAAAELLTGMYDASLDQFSYHNWQPPSLWNSGSSISSFEGNTNFTNGIGIANMDINDWIQTPDETHHRLANDGMDLIRRDLLYWSKDSSLHLSNSIAFSNIPNNSLRVGGGGAAAPSGLESNSLMYNQVSTDSKNFYAETVSTPLSQKQITESSNRSVSQLTESGQGLIKVRKNFNETAFFFPQLQADTSGNYSFSFTMPDALTRWKWMSLAHTKDLAFGTMTADIITQKKLMVQPNAPRFLREGDNIELSSKLVNMTDKEITGQVSLELTDAATGNSVDGWFQNIFPSQYFTIEAGQSFAVKFPIQVPFSFNRPLTWRIKATAGEFSDAEENSLPVLTNRTLVTETLPLFLGKDTTQHFTFDKLLRNKSESLTTEALTVEYSSNPAWNAILALPYLMEYPYECAEQTFNRLYANTLASWMVNREPRIKKLFEAWRADSTSFKSSLQKNPELKQVLLQETPWVLQAASEEEQQKNIAQLFDLARLSDQAITIMQKLEQMQLPDGAFPWFSGGYGDRYITQYILTGIGKLKRLGALSPEVSSRFRSMLVKAIQYMDRDMNENYKSILVSKTTQLILPGNSIDYLYMRSFFRDMAQPYDEAYRFFYNLAKKQWVSQNNYYKAQLGTVFFRSGDEKTAVNLIAPALLENTVSDSKQGLYWKNNVTRYWYQSPIEYQSMMISFFSELNQDKKELKITHQIDAMKTWLVLNKETNHWKTTIATADACYALLLNGSNWLGAERTVSIQLGNARMDNTNKKGAAGTGYFKKSIEGKRVSNEMGNITVSVRTEPNPFDKTASNSIPSYGAVYWQYFEDMDKITPYASPLSVTKKLYVEQLTDKGPVLHPLDENAEVKPGDKIIVQLELRSDRDMDYLHLKDLRASSMEPVNVLSGYKWQDGLGYYESTKDVSCNFFIDHLKKGTYVFRYAVYATHTGQFTAGIATIQSMYAPEFSSHSASLKIRVSN